MFLSALFIIFVIFIYIIANRYNKFAYIFSLYFIIISGLIIVTAIYISKISHYSSSSKFDNEIYLFLSQVKISIFTLARTYNLFMALYMLLPIIIQRILMKTNIISCFYLALPILYYVLINDPLLTWEIFIISNTDGMYTDLLKYVVPYIFKLNNVLIYLYSAMPIYLGIKKYFQTSLEFKRKYYKILTICISLITITFSIVFNIFLKNINGEIIGFTKVPINQFYHSQSLVSPFIVFIAIFIFIFATLYAKPIYDSTFTRKKQILSEHQRLTKNYKIMLHTYKNAFLGIEKITSILEKSIEKNDTVAIKECINMLKITATERTNTINQSLNFLKNPYIKQDKINLMNCINDAISTSFIDPSIKLSFEIATENTVIFGDKTYLQEAFVNVLNNAAQSLVSNCTPNPKIDISVSKCEEFIIISIRDNGIGIPKNNHNKIFTAFYSTKSPTKNSGIGLNCVQKIVKLHNGYVQVKSKFGEFFDFQIILPQYIEEVNYEQNSMGNL